MKIRIDSFGKLENGRGIDLFTLRNINGFELKLTNYGAAIVALMTPDKEGNFEHVILGFDELRFFEKIRNFYGAIVGRYANRIAQGQFVLDKINYTLAKNEGGNHLHGGINGFDRVIWDYQEVQNDTYPAVSFTYLSKDMEEGYPGNLWVNVTYGLTDDNELRINYEAKTDKRTVKNIANHAYFNLSGNLKSDILNHEIQLNADSFLPVVKGLIPTGEIRPVESTPFDFISPHRIGERINNNDEQLVLGGGYDHCWIINSGNDPLNFAGYLFEPLSGRRMDIFTTEPAIQFYSGNFMNGSHAGREGIPYRHRDAVVLETEHYPDSPNHAHFPSTVLSPGEVYRSTTIYKFSVQ